MWARIQHTTTVHHYTTLVEGLHQLHPGSLIAKKKLSRCRQPVAGSHTVHSMYMQVDDPSKYGVIILDEYGRVQQFVEKPKVRRAY